MKSLVGHVVRKQGMKSVLTYQGLLLLSVGLPVANAPDVLQPCGLLYYS